MAGQIEWTKLIEVLKRLRVTELQVPDWDSMFNFHGEVFDGEIFFDTLIEAKAKGIRAPTGTTGRTTKAMWEMADYRQFSHFMFEFVHEFGIRSLYVKFNAIELFSAYFEQSMELGQVLVPAGYIYHPKILEQFEIKPGYIFTACVTLSVKYHSKYMMRVLPIGEMLKKHFDLDYSRRYLQQAEINIMQKVNYKLDLCKVSKFCPLLILKVAENRPELNCRLLYAFLDPTLEYYHLLKRNILKRLKKTYRIQRDCSDAEFASFVADPLHMSSAIVTTLAMLTDEAKYRTILTELSVITERGYKDIETISNVILEILLQVITFCPADHKFTQLFEYLNLDHVDLADPNAPKCSRYKRCPTCSDLPF